MIHGEVLGRLGLVPDATIVELRVPVVAYHAHRIWAHRIDAGSAFTPARAQDLALAARMAADRGGTAAHGTPLARADAQWARAALAVADAAGGEGDEAKGRQGEGEKARATGGGRGRGRGRGQTT